MFEELESLRNAAQLLAVRDPEHKEQLLQACETLWERLYEEIDWPAQLADRMHALSNHLMANGSVEATLENLDEAGASTVARDIVEFSRDIKAGNGALAEK